MLQILNKTNLPAVSGTGLRRIIENMGQAGISFEGRDPFEVFKQVAQVIDSETDLQKKKTMQEQLFGEYGRMSLQLITDMKAGQALAVGISKSTGALNNANQVILDTTSKNWDQLTASLSELSIVIFSKFAPAIDSTLMQLSTGIHNLAQGNLMEGAMNLAIPAGQAMQGAGGIFKPAGMILEGLGKNVSSTPQEQQEVKVQLSLDDPYGLLKIQGVSNGANVGVNNVGTGTVLR
jgi:TP901 family phage tail tape measure protein